MKLILIPRLKHWKKKFWASDIYYSFCWDIVHIPLCIVYTKTNSLNKIVKMGQKYNNWWGGGGGISGFS